MAGKKHQDLTGQKQGNWTILKFLYIKGTNPVWVCKCGCGKKRKVHSSGGKLKSISCGCLSPRSTGTDCNKKPESYRSEFSSLFSRYKKDARDRNLSFNLTRAEFVKFMEKNCYYCNQEPFQKIYYILKDETIEVLYNGIDRVNNYIGYELDNCVTCCGKCNIIKKSITPEIIYKAYHFLFGVK